MYYRVVCEWGVLFFFSSRRRHTRSLRDWSSDVCSSDLGPVGPGELSLGALDSEHEQVPVVPVVATVRVRPLDRPVAHETRLDVLPELGQGAQQHLVRSQTAEEEPEEDSLSCPRLDCLEPR